MYVISNKNCSLSIPKTSLFVFHDLGQRFLRNTRGDAEFKNDANISDDFISFFRQRRNGRVVLRDGCDALSPSTQCDATSDKQ